MTTWENYISYDKPDYFYLATKQSIQPILDIDTEGFKVYHKKDILGTSNLIKWTAPRLKSIKLPKELDDKIGSHHWSKQLWDLFVDIGCLPIMDYEYENGLDVNEDRRNHIFNVQKRKMLRTDISESYFVLSSCCYTTFLIPGGLSFQSEISEKFDNIIKHYIMNEKEIEWSLPNNGQDGFDNVYQPISNDLAVYIKFRKTNKVSFERLEEYRCEILDADLIKQIYEAYPDVQIYRGKLINVF